MKILISKETSNLKFRTQRSRQRGNVLLVTLLLSVIMGTTLASYMMMAEDQSLSIFRSQNWNSSMVLTEAGVEDGLQMINKNPGTFDLTNWVTSASGDGYSNPSGNVYYVRRYMGSNYYDVYVTNSAGSADIFATGTAQWTYYISGAPRPQPMFAAVGVSTSTTPTPMHRSVYVKTKVDALFNVAMAALLTIDFKGNNVATDSFDSGNPAYSTNGFITNGVYWGGQYAGPNAQGYGNVNMTMAGGDVVTDDTITNSMNIGNADIKGHVKTGPNGTIALGPNGSVGDRNWVEGGTMGVESGYFSDDMNVVFPDVTMPAGAASWPSWSRTTGNGQSSQVNGVTYDYIITTSGDYQIAGDSNSKGKGGIYVASNCVVRLLVNGDVNLSGNAQIHIAFGASLKMYQNSSQFSLGGNGLVNENGFASSFYYFGLPINTAVNWGANANFVGVIYCPEADFTLGGGGNNAYDFIGASVSKTVRMNGHFNFHYDEALRRNGMGRGYIPTNWKES